MNQYHKSLVDSIWDYLTPSMDVEELSSERPDAIFVFGGIGDEIPMHAAKLFKNHVSDLVLITGKSGSLTNTHYKREEHEEFYDILINNGVSSENIIIEPFATNAGENVSFGMRKLLEMGLNIRKLALVSRSFMMRRAMLTFRQQFPDIVCFPSPPDVDKTMLVMKTTTLEIRLLEEIDRLVDYHVKGFISDPNIPHHIIENAKELRRHL